MPRPYCHILFKGWGHVRIGVGRDGHVRVAKRSETTLGCDWPVARPLCVSGPVQRQTVNAALHQLDERLREPVRMARFGSLVGRRRVVAQSNAPDPGGVTYGGSGSR